MLPITILDVLLLGFIIPQIYHRNGKNNLFNPIYNLYHIFTRLVINYWSPTAALIPCAIWGTPLMIYCRYLVLVVLYVWNVSQTACIDYMWFAIQELEHVLASWHCRTTSWLNYSKQLAKLSYKYTVKKLVHIKGNTAFNRLLISWRIRQWLRQWWRKNEE